MLLSIDTYAQAKRITGTILASDDSTLPGVSIYIKGTAIATTSDIDGKYGIDAKTGDVLVFKFIGFDTKEMTVKQGAVINVTLSPSSTALTEVVIIGYGKAPRPDVISSISTVSGPDLLKTNPTTIDQALQGKVPGVIVQQISGQPGGGVSVQIRGLNGFSNNPPLYVIDGLQIQTGAGDKGTNPLSSINPSEIESVQVLKDASATAIYGSQGSNGVIIVTTKRGRKGIPSISYDGYLGLQKLPKYYSVMDLRDYATFMNAKSGVIGYDFRPQFANPQYLGVGTNWQKALFRSAPMQNHNIAISGGDEINTYYLSGTLFSQDGIALGSNFTRNSVRFNFENKTTKWLKAGTNIQLANVKENVTTSATGVINQALNQTPDVPLVNPDGTYGGNDPNIYGAVAQNPYAIALIVKDNRKRYQVFGTAYTEIQFTKDLNLRNEVSGNFDFGTEDQFTPTYQMGTIHNINNSSSYNSSQSFFYSFTNYLNYNHLFVNKYDLSLMAGHEAKLSTYENVYASRTNFPSNNVQALTTGDALTAKNDGSKGQGATESYFGRLKVGLSDKYFIESTIRHDGVSKFGPAERWNTTYSGSLGWKISHEDFLKNIKAINDLKLRMGYGLQNNQNITEYAYGSTLNTITTSLSGNSQITATTGNPDVKWETTKGFNIGLDGSILNRRIEFSVDAYTKKTDGLLFSLTLPLYSGFVDATSYAPGSIRSPYINIGAVSNKGIEFSLTTNNIKSKNINWTTNITMSHNVNKILNLNTDGAGLYGYAGNTAITKSVVGRSIGEYYGYQTLGLFNTAADFTTHSAIPQKNGAPIPITNGTGGVWLGDVIFKDNNGDGKIDESDQTYLGSPIPKIQFGINNSIKIKDFDLNIFLSGNYGNKLFNQLRVNAENPNQNFGYFKSVLNYAQIGLVTPAAGITPNTASTDPTNYYITNPGTNITRISQSSGNGNERFSDRYIEDGSFIKCKSITLGYNFSHDILTKLHLNKFRLYANVTNAFTITKYKGYDPEIGSWNPLAAGVDNGYYAQPRVFTVGANISLNK